MWSLSSLTVPKSWMAFLGALFAFSIIGLVLWRSYSGYASDVYNANHEKEAVSQETGDKPATLSLFYATWCPACKHFYPIWTDAKAKLDGTVINGYDVMFTEIDCSDREDPEVIAMQTKYGVEGYPTMKLSANGNVMDFECERSVAGIEEFLRGMLSV